jgi:hypothetical protein
MQIRKVVAVLCAAAAFIVCGGSGVQASVVDLTGGGSGTVNNAVFAWTAEQPTGSGVIDSFVRIQSNDDIEQGYNTSFRPVQFDENTSPVFTRDLLLSTVSIVNIGGTDYRQFLLDINQTGSDPLLSLDELQVFLGSTGGLHDYPTGLGSLIYDLDAGSDSWIVLDASLNSGSGSGDMFAYIPNDLFTGSNQYVYLYSLFGEHYANNGGFEEWAVLEQNGVPVPEPGILGLLAAGFFGLPLFKRKSSR